MVINHSVKRVKTRHLHH